jgi:hypothetical protein
MDVVFGVFQATQIQRNLRHRWHGPDLCMACPRAGSKRDQTRDREDSTATEVGVFPEAEASPGAEANNNTAGGNNGSRRNSGKDSRGNST